jgi:hypothetical protein
MEALRVGAKIADESTGIEIIVVKPPSDSVLEFDPSGQVGLGKRYACSICGAEVIVARAGTGNVACHGTVMGIAQAKTLPSSD